MALTDKLTAIADAIRAKTGKTDSLTLDQMPTEIAGITTGGGGGSAEGCVTVTFMNGNVELFSRPVYIGDDCPDPVAQGRFDTPTKESTAQYDYTFYGWGASDGGAADDTILQNITEDKTVYAIFTATVRYYTITYYDEDGTTVLHSESLAYGATPSYTTTKTKENYTAAWNPELTSVVGGASYTLTWVENSWMWDLTNGVFTISGSGDVETYKIAERPWYSDVDKITSVKIENGITALSDQCFYGCTNLQSVTMADSVTKIGASCFYGCTNLQSVTLSNCLTSIGYGAFQNCNSLSQITLPDSITTISSGVFGGTCITDLILPAGLTALMQISPNNTTLKNVTIGKNVKSITRNAFYGCSNLSSVTFKDTSGWYVTQTKDATSGTSVSVGNASTNATNLKNQYLAYYWYDNT